MVFPMAESPSLAAIDSLSQVAGPRVLGSFALLGLFALIPTIFEAVKKRRVAAQRILFGLLQKIIAGTIASGPPNLAIR